MSVVTQGVGHSLTGDFLTNFGVGLYEFFVIDSEIKIELGPAIYEVELSSVSAFEMETGWKFKLEGKGYRVSLDKSLLSLILSPEDGN